MKNYNPLLSFKNHLLKNRIDKALVMDKMYIVVESLDDKKFSMRKRQKLKLLAIMKSEL